MVYEHIYDTGKGAIHYWTNTLEKGRNTLVFLPGLTADHRLFEKQIAEFENDFNILTWDAPLHAASRPFDMDFSLMDKAVWLHEILEKESLTAPVLIGQSMGGYVSQCFLERFPGEAAGFVSIDSAPIQRAYMTATEIWLLKRTGVIYRPYPWNSLKKAAIKGCAQSPYGRDLMKRFIETYTRDEYISLAVHGYRILAEAIEAPFRYAIDCPAILLCGKKDRAASTKRYNLAWTKKTGIPLFLIDDAGHNSNTDRPDDVNALIRTFAERLPVSK